VEGKLLIKLVQCTVCTTTALYQDHQLQKGLNRHWAELAVCLFCYSL